MSVNVYLRESEQAQIFVGNVTSMVHIASPLFEANKLNDKDWSRILWAHERHAQAGPAAVPTLILCKAPIVKKVAATGIRQKCYPIMAIGGTQSIVLGDDDSLSKAIGYAVPRMNFRYNFYLPDGEKIRKMSAADLAAATILNEKIELTDFAEPRITVCTKNHSRGNAPSSTTAYCVFEDGSARNVVTLQHASSKGVPPLEWYAGKKVSEIQFYHPEMEFVPADGPQSA